MFQPPVAEPEEFPYDVEHIREDFPILRRRLNGKPLVYLDNAATSQKPRQVIEALVDYYQRYNANVHRSVHTLAGEATEAFESARRKVARFLNAGPQEVVFTRGATEAINLVAFSWGRTFIREGDEILLTEMEHHSNLVPWQLLAKEKGARLRFIPVALPEGVLDLDRLDDLLTDRTRLVALTHSSNVLGTINPVAEVAHRAHEVGAAVLVDGAQSVPHGPVDVRALGCDFLAFSGHKMLGPTGIGGLYARQEWLERMPPFLGGGEMIMKVDWEGSTWNQSPYKFEAGTPNIGDAIALGTAVDYLEAIGRQRIQAHERALTKYALARLRAVQGLTLHGRAPARGGVISFLVEGIHPHDLAQVLDSEGVAIRAGHHCAQPLVVQRLGQVATARVSFYLYNTFAEIDRLIEAVEKAKEFFDVA